MRTQYWLVSLLFSMVLMSCGGGSGSSSSGSLPPDLSGAGDDTIQGVDSDNDGVRDDIQEAIISRYPNDEAKQEALKKQSMALQEAVIAGDSLDTNAISNASESITRSIFCLYETMEDPLLEVVLLEIAIMNTPERTAAYIKFNSALDGQVFETDFAVNPCN